LKMKKFALVLSPPKWESCSSCCKANPSNAAVGISVADGGKWVHVTKAGYPPAPEGELID